MPIFLWLLIGLPLVAAWVMRSSFNLGLYGDDWQHLYNLWRDFFVYHRKSFFDITSYLNPYWPSYLYLGIINHFWEFYAPAYFIASFLMRIFANIALYFLAFELTKSRLAGFITTVIFLFSAAGLQTTDWVFNMNTYMGLGLLCFAAVFYLKIRELNTFRSWNYLIFIIVFTLALAIVPTRMHGAVPFLILTDLYLTLVAKGKNFKINRYIVVRMITAVLIFATLLHFKSFGEGSFTTGRLTESMQTIQMFVERGYHAIWFYFLGILGHLVIPDGIGLEGYPVVILITGILSTLIGLIVSISIFKLNKPKKFSGVIVFNIIWALVLSSIASIDPNPLYQLNPYSSSNVLFSIGIGGQFIFWVFWTAFITRTSYPSYSSSFIISFIWIITLTIIYWLFTPYYIIETTGRYMTMGAAGFALFFGPFLALLFTNCTKFSVKSEVARIWGSFNLLIPTIILIFWLFVNFQSSQMYLGTLEKTRNRELTEKTWDTLIREVPTLDPEGPSVFFFSTDDPLSLQGVLVFGFFMRAGMTYRIPDQDLTPLPSTDYQELLAYVKDGSPLQKVHGRKAVPVPLNRIFAFDFRNGNLTNITDLARQKITEDLKIPN